MITGRLTMRALVERNQATATDDWGGEVAPDFQSTGDPLPCFIWSNREAAIVDGQKTAMIGDMRAMFAIGADIAEGDEIASVTTRSGIEIIPGRLSVEGEVQFKHTHLEADLRRIV